jgi:hypothetical protein
VVCSGEGVLRYFMQKFYPTNGRLGAKEGECSNRIDGLGGSYVKDGAGTVLASNSMVCQKSER